MTSKQTTFDVRKKSVCPKGRTKRKVSRSKSILPNDVKIIVEYESRFVPVLSDERIKELNKTTKRLMEPGKGILTVDETEEEIRAKLESLGLENTPSNRLGYILAVIGDGEELQSYISGVLLLEDRCLQYAQKEKKKTVLNMLNGYDICVGIRTNKVGPKGQSAPSCLDAYAPDCPRLKGIGVSFTMMHCVFDIRDLMPYSPGYLNDITNLARFASISQASGLVPVLSLEVRLPPEPDRSLDVTECSSIIEDILAFVVKALSDHHVYLEGAILRLRPVPAFLHSHPPRRWMPTPDFQVMAKATLAAIVHRIPPALGGVLLADGSDLAESAWVLNAINTTPISKPSLVSFAWGQVIKAGLAEEWKGKEKNTPNVTKLMVNRLKTCSLASMGQLPKEHKSIFVTNLSEM